MVLEEIQRLLWWETQSEDAGQDEVRPQDVGAVEVRPQADNMPAWMRAQQVNNQLFDLGSLEPEEDGDEAAEEACVSGDATDRRSWPQWMRRQRRANRRLRLRDDAYGLTVFLAENSETSSGSESSDTGEIGHGAIDMGLVAVRPPQESCFGDEPGMGLEDAFAALDEWGTPELKADDDDQVLKSHPSSNSLVISDDCQSPGTGNIEGRRRRYGIPRMPSLASTATTASTLASESDWAPAEKDVPSGQVPVRRDAFTTLRVPAPTDRGLHGSFQRSGPMAAEREF